MSGVVTVEKLAEAKQLPVEALHSFGLANFEAGVRFKYRDSRGMPARPRLRTAMRGADGSQWDSTSTLPITTYSPPSGVQIAVDPSEIILVEGESDCWSAWFHGVAACGIPGPEHWDKIEEGNVVGFETIYIIREPATDDSPTYREGVDAYIDKLCQRLRTIGFQGPILELQMPDGLFDLSELHQADPDQFVTRLQNAKRSAKLISDSVHKILPTNG